jgi:hypothetical protein
MNNPWDRVYASSFFAGGLFLFLLGGLQFRFWEWKLWKPLAWPLLLWRLSIASNCFRCYNRICGNLLSLF